MSMTIEGFKKRAKMLEARGYTAEEAQRLAVSLGDVIECVDGKWGIRDENDEVLARIDPLE
jgi:hypothetical protein